MRICDKCRIIPAAHYISNAGVVRHLCCRCFVEEGNPPADWHRLCMETYRRIKDSEKKE